MALEGSQVSPHQAEPKNWPTLVVVLVGLLTLAGLWLGKLPSGPSLRLKTCFQDVGGLHAGARVRLAGVDVGTVRDVRARPTDKTCTGAVEMELRTPYELEIPQDSVASISTAGILGETYLEIDASHASRPPVGTDGQLPSKESVKFTAATVDRALRAVELMKQLSDEEKSSNAQSPKIGLDGKPSSKPSPPSVLK
jgi:ABC-type transporter Mla subunit MlaD